MGLKMAARIPLVRQISWLATAPTLAVLALAIAFGVYLAPENGVLWGTGAFVVYSISSKRILGRHPSKISFPAPDYMAVFLSRI